MDSPGTGLPLAGPTIRKRLAEDQADSRGVDSPAPNRPPDLPDTASPATGGQKSTGAGDADILSGVSRRQGGGERCVVHDAEAC